MAGKLWTRDETLVAFNLYCRTPFGRLHARNQEIIELASALGRTPTGRELSTAKPGDEQS